MADGVTPTVHDVEIAAIGVMTQVEALGLKDLLDTNEGFRKFVQNRIDVCAYDMAYINMLCEALQK